MLCCRRSRPVQIGSEAPGSGSSFSVVNTPYDSIASASKTATVNWGRIYRKLQRLRFLQRLWGNLGQFLQLIGSDLRAQLRLAYPAGRQ